MRRGFSLLLLLRRALDAGDGRSGVASLKAKPRIAPGPCSRRCISPSKRMSIPAAAFRSSHVISAGTGVVLNRRIRRAAFVGAAARARSCRHALFMLRFLARGSAGTDGSVIGHAGRGLALSRRNERRAEERRDDKSRDCKFGSHQKCLHGVTEPLQTSTGDLVPLRDQHCANFIFQRTRVWPLRNIRHLPNIRHAPNTGFAQSSSIDFVASTHHKLRAKPNRGKRNVGDEYQESSLLKVRGNDVIAVHRA